MAESGSPSQRQDKRSGSTQPANTVPYDPQALLSLYGMSAGLYGGMGGLAAYNYPNMAGILSAASTTTTPSTPSTSSSGLGTLGVAASQATSLGLSPQQSAAWWSMASQLATQEYLSRVQAASRDPAAYALLAQQGGVPGYEQLLQGVQGATVASKAKSTTAPTSRPTPTWPDGVKLPADTEIVKTLPSSYNNKPPKKKAMAAYESGLFSGNGNATSRSSPIPNIPAGLTIEKKKPGRKPMDPNYHVPSSGQMIDRVEITKIPVNAPPPSQNGTSTPVDMSKKEDDDAPLNLSMKSESDVNNSVSDQPLALTVKNKDKEKDLMSSYYASNASKIPSDYYASQALSGVFLAEQIRQQQLASELENHLQTSQNLSAMQALLMGKISRDNNADTQRKTNDLNSATFKNLGRGSTTIKPKKNTVASLLAKSREESMAEKGLKATHPELTIEPIFKSTQSESSAADSEFDMSHDGRRYSTVIGEDGRIQIKTANDSPEIKNLSDSQRDSEDEDDGSENEDGTSIVAPSKSSSPCSLKSKGRYAVRETEDLKAPLREGWKRETTIREYSKSGIRGEVVYVGPCGKKFKQYPDIMRYLDKKGMSNLKREHFSFSTKLLIGDFLKPTGKNDSDTGEEKYVRYGEEEMITEIDRIRKENGWKPRNRRKDSSKSGGKDEKKSEAGGEKTDQQKMEEQYKLLQRLQADAIEREKMRVAEQEQIKLQKEAMRILKEAEKQDKMHQARREREEKQRAYIEEKRKKHEEISRQKQEEKLKKLQELEVKRQQAALYKEQERERRRQHMILVKQLDMKKKNDERKKRIEDLRVEKEKEKERRIETRRLELEIISEMRKPVEDMCLAEAKPFPELERIMGLKLPGDAFANLLMVFEFLHNFGETLGFDMESLPTLHSLQSALLNEDSESEEELLSIMTHLVVCAIEDPGIPTPHKHLTILGQNLRQADITNTNISEILRIFIAGRAQWEVKVFHNVTPPDSKDKKDPMYVKMNEEYMDLLKQNKTYQMSQSIQDKQFLCLNALDKSEILGFLCNELLNNKAVVNQIEVTVDNVHITRRRKWSLENKIKKLRMLHARKFKFRVDLTKVSESMDNSNGVGQFDSKEPSEAGEDKDDTMSIMSESTRLSETNLDSPKKAKGKKKNNKKGGKKKLEDELDLDEEMSEDEDMSEMGDEIQEEAEDAQLSAEDLQKKIERLTKQANKKNEEHIFVSNTLRATEMGQDRYRRRYWHLAHAGGIFVEGMESAEPWKIPTRGLPEGEEEPPTKKIKVDGSIKEEEERENKENIKLALTSTPTTNKERDETEEALKKLGSEIMVTPKMESKWESSYTPKVTPNGDNLNLFNHSAYFNMSVSPVILNGSVTITPKEWGSSQYSGGQTVPSNGGVVERPWFSIICKSRETCDSKPEVEFHPARRNLAESELAPQISFLEHKLEVVKHMDKESTRKATPPELCYGWWKISDEETISKVEACLLQKGTREQNLLLNLKRASEAVFESTKKLDSEEISLMPPEEEKDEDDETEVQENRVKVEEIVPGAPRPCEAGSWSRSVALRVDKYILDQVEALEDKVAAASMQVPGWKLPERNEHDISEFRPSCEHVSEHDPRLDPIALAKKRLLDLEANIERRYLKAPLGHSNAGVSLKTITEKQEKEEKDVEPSNGDLDQTMDIDGESNQEEPIENIETEASEINPNDESLGENLPNREIPRGLHNWREGVKQARNAAQLAMGFYVLETSIAWHKSIMKASCQFCHCGDNEEALLLCDGCDKGYHTYCFKPPITDIPEGDWYCFECINKATGLRHCLVCGSQEEKHLILCATCPRAYHADCIQPNMAKIMCPNGFFKKTPRGKWHCPGCNMKNPKKKSKKARPLSFLERQEPEKTPPPPTPAEEPTPMEESPPPVEDKPKKARPNKVTKLDKDLSICHTLLSELGGHEEAWPFLYPVPTKQFPTYKKIIRAPMDVSTIRKKLNDGMYKSREEFKGDVNLIFANCEIFNEDDSPVGKAGHSMKNFFNARWTELTAS